MKTTEQANEHRLGFINAFRPEKQTDSTISFISEWAHNYAYALMSVDLPYDILYAEAIIKIRNDFNY
jgi:hypothetical protein